MVEGKGQGEAANDAPTKGPQPGVPDDGNTVVPGQGDGGTKASV